MRKILGFFGTALLITCLTGVIGIYDADALTVSPSRIELTGNPGDIIDYTFIVANEQNETRTFYTDFENFEASGETGTPSFLPGTEDLASWIKAPSEIVLKKGEQQTIPFTINIPSDAEPGGHFAAIFLSTIPPTAEGGGEVAVGAKIGVLVLLRVSGEVKEGGGIMDFAAADSNKFFTRLPVNLIYRFHNDGGDRVNPQGDIVIKNLFGLTKTTLPANKGEGNVLPGSTRKFQVVWGTPEENPDTKISFFKAASYELRNFAFGIYTAHLSLDYGTNNHAEKSYTMYLFPWQLLLISLILILIVVFILRVGIKRYNRWIIKRYRQP